MAEPFFHTRAQQIVWLRQRQAELAKVEPTEPLPGNGSKSRRPRSASGSSRRKSHR